ncbi:primase-helicase zinc-binding domain-containing protein [Paraburkholderia sp. BL10I2N1]|uniref:primase-helicase zinc-binding domain-containing protein n=1 Tax=Paraburkholderia sp. BL10I2N1 TaxID=1938796 RepID=UPI00105B87E1|nr:primase-helicase zinc-binding domain-containing protein [Paraburkholderia sp. BL10I2N1]TDN59077.1 putative DNA primase/helicase [Paraburkholderia sp. BL10I2N1]
MNVKDLKLTPAQWLSLLQSYGVPESSLTGGASPCPVCGGEDRFTYDNKRGRGDWVCRKCDAGNPTAGDGLALICRVSGLSFFELMHELEGGSLDDARHKATTSRGAAPAPGAKRKADPAYVEKRLTSMWDRAKPLAPGDLAMRYLLSRVPNLRVTPSKALRLGMLEYRHDKKVIGSWPGIIARYELPDGRLGTLHRTFLERSTPGKARIVTADGEILDAKLNDMTLNPLAGGAVRLMEPVNGEIGVGEGLETVYAAHMQFGVPVWYCLNRIHLSQFVVPEGLGIRVVHIFVDFDHVDQKTGKSPGVVAGVELAKRLKAEGYVALIHRPKLRGTDFCDEWVARMAACGGSDFVPRTAREASRSAAAV